MPTDRTRDPSRIDQILDVIRELWLRSPDLRLMQLLANVLGDGDHFHLEDADLLKALLQSLGAEP